MNSGALAVALLMEEITLEKILMHRNVYYAVGMTVLVVRATILCPATSPLLRNACRLEL